MTFEETLRTVSRITYKPGWSVRINQDSYGGRPYIQLDVDVRSDATLDPTGQTSERTPWRSAKRYLSPHMCKQEVVGAVMGLITDAEMHEVREWFRYRGDSIFNPHLDPDVLAEVAKKKESFCVRENAMSMEETQ